MFTLEAEKNDRFKADSLQRLRQSFKSAEEKAEEAKGERRVSRPVQTGPRPSGDLSPLPEP